MAGARWSRAPCGSGSLCRIGVRALAERCPLLEVVDLAHSGVDDKGVAALAESDLRVATDNPLTGALLALLRAAAFPGDTLAREHVRMSPLEPWLEAEGLVGSDALTLRVLAEVQALGFAGTLESWLRRLEPALQHDEFSRERGRLLVAAAERFDEGGSRDVAEFLEFQVQYAL